MKKRIVVIGGGAAGFFAAITAAEANPCAEVLILERAPDVLGKVRISGGGRCNVTHACFDPTKLSAFYPRGAKQLRSAFHEFHAAHTVEWFAERGVKLKAESDGRMFPITDSSQTIIDCLVQGAQHLGVKIWTKCGVKECRMMNAECSTKWEISLTTSDLRPTTSSIHADALIITTGNNASMWKLLTDLGHTIVPPVPSLFTFNIDDARITDLAGVSVQNAKVKLVGSKLQTEGALLITHWGMSGPAILRLSAWGARDLHERQYQFQIAVNWTPKFNPETMFEALNALKNASPKKQISTQTGFGLPTRLWRTLVGESGIHPEKKWADVSKSDLRTLAEQLTNGIFSIKGKSTNKDEFVTCGGVSLREVNFKTMESKVLPKVYFAGEVLDIDAITGGFNFQNAWTTGYIAGKSIHFE